jgi:hypothetical protein
VSKLVSLTEASRLLNCDYRTLRRRAEGLVPAAVTNGRFLFKASQFEALRNTLIRSKTVKTEI